MSSPLNLFTRMSKLPRLSQKTDRIISDPDQLVSQDGIDHICVDNRAKTLLGRMLDSQYIAPFIHPELGRFNTTEGFWNYITMEEPDELLRMLNGHECRKYIKELRESGRFQRLRIPNFFTHICIANWLKITQNPELLKLVQESRHPFRIYYVHEHHTGRREVIEREHRLWVAKVLEEARTEVKSGKVSGDYPFYIDPVEYYGPNGIVTRISEEAKTRQGIIVPERYRK